ncbi:MAG: hypothetical protein LBT24_04130 [Tannerella sp.]|jgi:hypothetical protein|nr:hypothetical protein [Tannerella sp.]
MKKFVFNPKLNLLWCFLFCSWLIYGQNSLNVIDLYHDSSLNEAARTIEAKADVGEYIFHAGIGGVSFEAVAVPATGLTNQNIALDYEGGNLLVKIGDKVFYPKLSEWQLIPIVKFADSPYQVAFSALGDTTNNKEAQCKYHPAFLNSLLGLRIFQIDLLNIPGVLWDLPKDKERNYILAESENSYIPRKDSVLNVKLYEELIGSGRQFTSFLFTDKYAEIIFDTEGNKLSFSGHPDYFFTKNNMDAEKVSGLREQVEYYYQEVSENAKIFLGNQYTSDLDPKTNLSGLRKKLDENKNKAANNPFPFYRLRDALTALDSLNKLSNEQIGIKFQTLDSFSASFGKNWTLLKKYNYPVYAAMENISHWAAFFRYVKKTNPDNWAAFVEKVRQGKIFDAPEVITPTSYEINYIRIFRDKKIMAD